MGKTADLTVVHKEGKPQTFIAKEAGYSCRIPLVKPLMNHRQRQRRLTWAKEKKNRGLIYKACVRSDLILECAYA